MNARSPEGKSRAVPTASRPFAEFTKSTNRKPARSDNVDVHWRSKARLAFLMPVFALFFSACSSTPAADSWQEEVLLHDGRTLIVDRSQTYGGTREVGQGAPIRELRISFQVPGKARVISWTSEYGDEIGRTNFVVVGLHLLGDVPYVIAKPNLCLAYNKWGRPDPPYVIFRHDGSSWNRIDLKELPLEFKTTNMVVSTLGLKYELPQARFVSAAQVHAMNQRLGRPEYSAILREKINYDPDCIEMVSNGKGVWRAMAWFRGKPTLAACTDACFQENYDAKTCPCPKIFGGKQE